MWSRNVASAIEDMNSGKLGKAFNRSFQRHLNQKRNAPAAWTAFAGDMIREFYDAAGVTDPQKQRAIEVRLIQAFQGNAQHMTKEQE